jgi:hypothetical protein
MSLAFRGFLRRDQTLATEQGRQPGGRNDRNRPRRLRLSVRTVLPAERHPHSGHIDDIVGTLSQPIGPSQKEGVFVGRMSSEPDDESFLGRLNPTPERAESAFEFRPLKKLRPPLRSRRGIVRVDRPATEVVEKRQHLVIRAGDLDCLAQGAASRVAGRDVQRTHSSGAFRFKASQTTRRQSASFVD